jgi:hypothetical protein
MIIFNYDVLDQFLEMLPNRAINQIFTQYIEPKNGEGLPSQMHKLVLQFLGRPDPSNTNFLVMYQTAIKISSKKERDEVIANLRKAFDAGGIQLVQGCINEIFMSIS